MSKFFFYEFLIIYVVLCLGVPHTMNELDQLRQEAETFKEIINKY